MHSNNAPWIWYSKATISFERARRGPVNRGRSIQRILQQAHSKNIKKRMLQEYELSDIAHMPYLWSCVDPPFDPTGLTDLRNELANLRNNKRKLPRTNDAMDRKEAELEHSITVWEAALRDERAITPSSMERLLAMQHSHFDNRGIDDMERKDIARLNFALVEEFQTRIVRDHKALRDHAQKRFFKNDCRISSWIELKPHAQVMLLQNIDLSAKLANGSRGIVKGFVSTRDYLYLLHDRIGINVPNQSAPLPSLYKRNESSPSSPGNKQPSEQPHRTSFKSPKDYLPVHHGSENNRRNPQQFATDPQSRVSLQVCRRSNVCHDARYTRASLRPVF